MLNRQAKPGEGGQAPWTERMKIYLAELGEKADSSVQGGNKTGDRFAKQCGQPKLTDSHRCTDYEQVGEAASADSCGSRTVKPAETVHGAVGAGDDD